MKWEKLETFTRRFLLLLRHRYTRLPTQRAPEQLRGNTFQRSRCWCVTASYIHRRSLKTTHFLIFCPQWRPGSPVAPWGYAPLPRYIKRRAPTQLKSNIQSNDNSFYCHEANTLFVYLSIHLIINLYKITFWLWNHDKLKKQVTGNHRLKGGRSSPCWSTSEH